MAMDKAIDLTQYQIDYGAQRYRMVVRIGEHMLSAEFFESILRADGDPGGDAKGKGGVNEKESIGLCIIRNTGSVDLWLRKQVYDGYRK